jgi:ribosomal protein L44E
VVGKNVINMKIIVSKEDKNYINECLRTGEVLKEDLRRWFKEKWVDVSKKVDGKHPPCGRKDADGKSYPKCRPSKKVSKETPKITSSYSKEEKKSMTAQKRRAEKKDPKVGKGNKPTMTHFNENKDVKIVCDNCGWSWNLSDGGDDPYTCHKCGCNNSKKYKKMKLKITETQYIRIFEEGPVEETEFVPNDMLTEAEYQGRKVQLGKIMQGDIKKFKVYVKNDKGKVVKVNFGFGGKSAHGKRMVIKKNNPERRKSFRARMRCDNPGPRWKPRYWACRTW